MSALWVCALLTAAVLAVNPSVWHEDASEQHCAVCHVSHLPLLTTKASVSVEQPTDVVWHSPLERYQVVSRVPLVSISGRAPPA